MEKTNFTGLTKVEFSALKKEARMELSTEVRSISFWCKTISAASFSSPKIAKVLTYKLGQLDKKKDARASQLLAACKAGYKFYDKDGNICKVKKIKEGDTVTSVYSKKETFTFASVWGAIVSPPKESVIVTVTEEV